MMVGGVWWEWGWCMEVDWWVVVCGGGLWTVGGGWWSTRQAYHLYASLADVSTSRPVDARCHVSEVTFSTQLNWGRQPSVL
jgi:hypothetical protein